ncbi:hypothetical protein B9479_000331 [Cryptococcus floricola]|uniref:FMP27 GFWDK domain-containing protein n=1 Tax=Cryptococcus floricola TaxID=2591691 RepID=A0A5D3B894_9TREE|nr:hypothetical protein B9479_000331 [Cryptococcus floricola]
MPSFNTIALTLLALLITSFIFRFHILPFLLRLSFPNLRLDYISLLSARGVEWRRPGRDEGAPTVTIERAGFTWGGAKGEVTGLVVLRIEGICLRLKQGSFESGRDKKERVKKQPGRLSSTKTRFISNVLQLLIHHYPSVTRVISVQIINCRIVFEDLNEVEMTVKELGFGVNVDFQGEADLPDSPFSTSHPKHTYKRDYPLHILSPVLSPAASGDESDFITSPTQFSPPASPLNQHSFAMPPSAPSEPSEPTRPKIHPTDRSYSRLSHARRRASVFQSRMSSTASKIWTRAAGRKCGSVCFSAYVDTIRCIEPSPSPPGSAKPSVPDLKPPKSPFGRAFQSRRRPPPITVTIPDSGVEALVAVEERSRVKLSLGFGPKKGLLGEDTLSVDAGMGKLSTTLEAVERIKALLDRVKKEPAEKKAKTDQWSSHGSARIMLRALESAKVAFSHITFTHYLKNPHQKPSRPVSATSSISELDISGQPGDDRYILALELTDISCTLSAADSSNNDRARNAFGTNFSPASVVRGVGAQISWQKIEFQCVAPGEENHEKSQLLAIRQAEFTGFSSWRPQGWSREEMLFASDPNLALVVCFGKVASVDLAGDMQLLHELEIAWKATHPKVHKAAKKEKSEPLIGWLPPRLRMVLDVGSITAVLADRVSKETTTLTFHLDGLHYGAYTSFTDIVARRRDRSAARTAFEQEEQLQARRETNHDVDHAMHPSMLPQAVRRLSTANKAELRDGLSISMRGDATIRVEPIQVNMTLAGDRIYELAEIGRLHGTFTGDVLGRCEVKEDGSESATLDFSSISSRLDMGLQEGITVDLWRREVVEALVIMGEAHQKRPWDERPPPPPPPRPILDILPSGISARVSLGKVNILMGVKDPNPGCHLGLIRGVWFQSVVVLEYAFYKNAIQALPWRHTLTTARRAKLRLPEDITTQALAFAAKYQPGRGGAALVAINTEDTYVQPVFNGKRFVEKGGVKHNKMPKDEPKAKDEDEFVGWAFQRAALQKKLGVHQFANNVRPLDLSDAAQASRPWLRIPTSRTYVTTQQSSEGAETEFKITSKTEGVALISDLSHVYCNLLAGLTIKRMILAWKRPKPPRPASLPLRNPSSLSIDFTIPNFQAHFAFPLDEQIYVYAHSVTLRKRPYKGLIAATDHILAYVPSPRFIGSWEELLRVKTLAVALSDPHLPLVISPTIESIRFRIPFAYKLNNLVLNINVTIKALKLLRNSVSGKTPFTTVSRPAAEMPKRIPMVSINIGYMSLEAKDDPVETSLNLIWRAGMVEQTKRNLLEDQFAKKLLLISDPDVQPDVQDEAKNTGGRRVPVLTKKHTVSAERARWALDTLITQSWTRRIRAAKHEQARRENVALQPMMGCGTSTKLPIKIAASSKTAPLFRAAFQDVSFVVADPGLNREEIIDYMGKVSSPFRSDAEFSLMVPLSIQWSMGEVKCSLRDYPLPMLRVQRVESGESQPAFRMETTMIIAEELGDEQSVFHVPVTVIPEACGDKNAAAFVVQIAKTISPVKTYAEPRFKIASKRTTEFTWGNSYQPAIQDFMKVVETLSHPPADPSPRVGFWDKFRLVLHWKPIVDFVGPCHLHLKGSFDPYSVSGIGSGFCLAWRGSTRLLIDQPNEEGETIQIIADELVVAIPDLAPFHDGAAIGNNRNGQRHDRHHGQSQDRHESGDFEQTLIERRYTKPCARFVNGVKVGFGFKFERTCRPWTCDTCGKSENVMHRKCRLFAFKQHQDVRLRSPAAIAKDEKELGRKIDSYEGFRSDFVHFSISLSAPNGNENIQSEEYHPDRVNSLHFAPKASHHFLAWWKLFGHQMSLPIRHGSLFPDSPPPSKKFGRSLGTMKYRFDLRPVYISHMYFQVSKDHSATGKSESLGIKGRIGRIRADVHQRAQEKIERHEKLGRSTVVVHKPFYAVDILADDIKVKGLRAHFDEHVGGPGENDVEAGVLHPKASELPLGHREWYNYLDYIDADRKPIDKNPRIELVNFGECPHFFYCKRVKARTSTSGDDSPSQATLGLETSKFGHEPTHPCYLGTAEGVREVQQSLTRQRINELREKLSNYPLEGLPQDGDQLDKTSLVQRINILEKHHQDLAHETRRLSDDTFTDPDAPRDNGTGAKEGFEDTIHVHGPRLFLTNSSRNIAIKYMYMMGDRKKEEYFTSYSSLRSILEGFQQRMTRQRSYSYDEQVVEEQSAQQILNDLVSWLVEKPASESIHHVEDPVMAAEVRRGLPDVCDVKPKTKILVFMPQIALRSEAHPDAILLMSMEEVSFKQFKVLDEHALDNMMAEVLNRNYVTMSGLQGFYPNENALNRERTGLGLPHGLDFIPLEIFLDVKSEAKDYDRVLQKTTINVAMDKFNHIRMPQGLEWPEAVDDRGDVIKHLRLHQDFTAIVAPTLTVTANSQNFDALYTIVTNLLMYDDPEHKGRSDAVDDFSRTFDAADRDIPRLIADVNALQTHMRHLVGLRHGYESHFDQLDKDGQEELFKIRSELHAGYESMYTVNALIRATLAKDDARAAMKTASKMDVRIGGVAWHMLKDQRLETMAKVDITGVLFSMLNNKNGTMDNAMVLGDLKALNGRSNMLYPEIIVRDEPAKKKIKKAFSAVYWSTRPPIGGIPILPNVNIEFVNILFRLEESVGLEVMDYIFADRTRRREATGTAVKGEIENGATTPNSSFFGKGNGNGNINANASTDDLGSRRANASTTDFGSVHKSKSQVSLVPSQADRDIALIKMIEDTREMRLRASTNKMFGTFRLQGMGLNLSYKSDDSRKHGTFSMPDCVDFKFKTPEMVYVNKVWAMEDLFEHIKRDIKNSAWSQSGDIISQIFKKTSLFRSKERLKQAASVTAMAEKAQKGKKKDQGNPPISPSNLRYTMDHSSPSPEPDPELLSTLSRALSRDAELANSNSINRMRSRSTHRAMSMSAQRPSTPQAERRESAATNNGLQTSSLGRSSGSRYASTSLEENRGETRDSGGNGDNEEKSRIKGLFGKLKAKNLGHSRESRSSEDSSFSGSRVSLRQQAHPIE